MNQVECRRGLSSEFYRRGTAAAILAVTLAGSCASSTARPSTLPPAEPSPSTRDGTRPPARCSLIRRAPRMWVGFSDDMALDDFENAGLAAHAIIQALDDHACELAARPYAHHASQGERSLRRAARRAARSALPLHATSLQLHDAALTGATARIESSRRSEAASNAPDATAQPAKPSWLIALTLEAHGYRVVTVTEL